MSGEAINRRFANETDRRTFSKTSRASFVIRPASGQIVSMNRREADLLQIGYPMKFCN